MRIASLIYTTLTSWSRTVATSRVRKNVGVRDRRSMGASKRERGVVITNDGQERVRSGSWLCRGDERLTDSLFLFLTMEMGYVAHGSISFPLPFPPIYS
jgi:hypothetical protein